MDRGEPTLAPEWLKAAGTSLHSDEHNTGTLSRNRLAVSVCDHDAPRASSSSFRRSASSNGSMGHDKDGYAQSRAYSSFGRSHRDRDRDRDRDRQRNREKDNLLVNGYSDYDDSLMTRRTEKDTLRRSQSLVTGRRVESVAKRPGSDSSNSVSSVGSLSSGLSKVSFERDFPSLGAEEKQGLSDVGRVSSPGISTAINSLHISTSAIIGADGWTSALAEVPAESVGNGPSMSSGLQTAANMSSAASSTTTGLSMAETLAQAPRARTAPQLSNENERRKEQTLMQQYNKLIPVVNSTEKSKTKGARNGDLHLIAPKGVHQPSSQLVPRLTVTKQPDILKTSQAGNFRFLNQKKNGTSPTAKDGPPLTTANRVATSLSGVPSPSSHLKSPANPKPKANGVGGEKKPLLQAQQEKHDFFNSIRKQSVMKNGVSHHHPELSCGASSPSSVSSLSNSVMRSDEQVMGGDSAASACQEKNMITTSCSGLECRVSENCNVNACDEEEPEAMVAPNDEEKAFLYSLGWNENAGEGALTAEEILSFVKKHEEKLGPDFKYKAGLPEMRLNGRSSSGSSSSSSEAEM